MNNIRFSAPGFTQIDAPPIPGCEGQPSQTYFVTRITTLPEGWQDILTSHSEDGGVLWRVARLPPSNN